METRGRTSNVRLFDLVLGVIVAVVILPIRVRVSSLSVSTSTGVVALLEGNDVEGADVSSD